MSRIHFKHDGVANGAEDRFFRVSSANFTSLQSLSLQDIRMELGEARHAHFPP